MTNLNKLNVDGDTIITSAYGNGSASVKSATLALSDAARTGDVIYLDQISAGSIIHGFRQTHEVIGAGVTVNFGLINTALTDPDYFLGSVDCSSASGSASTAAPLHVATDTYITGTITAADKVTNGAFAADSGWTKGSGWSIAAGVATRAAGASTPTLTQDITPVEGQSYYVTFDLVVSAGTTGITVALNGGTASDAFTTSGSKTCTLVAGASGTLTFTAGADFAGDLDNVVVRAVPEGVIHSVVEFVYDGI